MTDRYQNRYRIASARASWWDYGWNGAYFITICTKNRECFFGEIRNEKMFLSQTGVIADILWHEIPNHAPFVELGDFVVMPNHIHGILILDKPDDGNNNQSGNDDDNGANATNVVETRHALSLRQPQPSKPSPTPEQQPSKTRFQNQGINTVSSIIGGYKSAVTKHANRLRLENGWQSRFHDHIIRDDQEYQRIADYIVNNPANWRDDKFFSL